MSTAPGPTGALRGSQAAWVGIALFLLVWFCNLDYRHLIRTDEGRYAEIAREMVVSGDWITPRQNGYKYFEKPPLQYWATATAFELFGIHEWTARLWTALCGLMGIAFTFFAARRIWDVRVATLAAVILGGTLQWVAMGHFSSLDMSLAAFLSAAIAAFCAAHGPHPSRSAPGRDAGRLRTAGATATAGSAAAVRPLTDPRWMMAAWACAALATLSKGIVAMALPAATIGLYMLWRRDWDIIRRSRPIAGGALFIVITAPWFVLVAGRNPEFLQFFFIQEHLSRFLTPMHGRNAPLWFFVPVLIGGLMPWTLALPAALKAAWPRSVQRFDPAGFLGLWVVVSFCFFSLSHSKLESYILPIYPALAVLLALTLPGLGRRAFGWLAASNTLAGVALAGATVVMVERGSRHIPAELLGRYEPWLIGAGVALAAAGLIAGHLDRTARRVGAIITLAAGSLLASQLALSGHESLAPLYSSYHTALGIRPLLTPDTPFYSVDTYDHTMPFYAGRTLIMVGYKDEMAVPIDREPGPFLPDLARFEQAWRAAPHALALMTAEQFSRFEQAGLPMAQVARDPRRVIVSKP